MMEIKKQKEPIARCQGCSKKLDEEECPSCGGSAAFFCQKCGGVTATNNFSFRAKICECGGKQKW